MNKNLLAVLIFVLVLVGLLWAMPNRKIKYIGDFFEKIITPVSAFLALLIAAHFGIMRYRKNRNKKNDNL